MATYTNPRPKMAYNDHFCLLGSFMFHTSQNGSNKARKSVVTLRYADIGKLMASLLGQWYLPVYVGEKRSQYELRGWHCAKRTTKKAIAYAMMTPIAPRTTQENNRLSVPAAMRRLKRRIDTLIKQVLITKKNCAIQAFYISHTQWWLTNWRSSV